MSKKKREEAVIISKREISAGIFDMWIRTDEIAGYARAGQFVSLYCKDGSRLLPRPISICEIEPEKKALRLVYRVAGAGTEEFSRMDTGEKLKIVGPLGNGFPFTSDAAFVIGGGIGIPPMLELARVLKCEKQMVLGYRDQLFLNEEFEEYGPVAVATEDGSAGTQGNVLDAIRKQGLTADVIYACGPMPMLRALKAYALEQGMECWLSLEERMACGIGACLACVCQSRDIDSHSQVHNKRICKDGPVFAAQEVEL